MIRKEIFVVILASAAIVLADQSQEITTFRLSALTTIHGPWVNVYADTYGHDHRSQTTLTAARQDLFRDISIFPVYRLSSSGRQNLTMTVDKIIKEIDATTDYLKKNSMDKYYAFNTDTKTVLEETFSAADSQLEAWRSQCPKSKITARQLTTEYLPFLSAINVCTQSMATKLRPPINEFTRVHFIALPLINRIDRDLRACMNILALNNIEKCSADFSTKYCVNGDNCTTIPTITAVRDQAEKMVKDARADYDVCLSSAKDSIPTTPTFFKNCLQDPPSDDEFETEDTANEATQILLQFSKRDHKIY